MNESALAIVSAKFGGEWRSHPRQHGYFFARDGRASSYLGKAPRLLVGTMCGYGYRAISCSLGNGKYRRVYIHRAVCEIFNGGSGAGLHCRHLDTDMTNCAASNLAWGTALENAADSITAGKTARGERNGASKLTAQAVQQMRSMRQESGKTFRAIAHEFGVTTMTAHRAITGALWK